MRRENDRFQHSCLIAFNISSKYAGYAMNYKIEEPPSSPSLNYVFFVWVWVGKEKLGRVLMGELAVAAEERWVKFCFNILFKLVYF